MGCTDPLRRGVGAPHQCPLGSVASYLVYADVRTFRWRHHIPVSGTLKGFDPLVNLVLDNTIEYLRGKWSTHPSCNTIFLATIANWERLQILFFKSLKSSTCNIPNTHSFFSFLFLFPISIFEKWNTTTNNEWATVSFVKPNLQTLKILFGYQTRREP